MQYDKRIFYDTYDATASLQDGKNAIAVALGLAWPAPLASALPLPSSFPPAPLSVGELAPFTPVAAGTWWYATNSSYFYNPPFQLPFGPRMLALLLRLRYQNGTTIDVTSQPATWTQSEGLVVSDDMFLGEVRPPLARLKQHKGSKRGRLVRGPVP